MLISNKLKDFGIYIFMEENSENKYDKPYITINYQWIYTDYDFINCKELHGTELTKSLRCIVNKWIKIHKDELLDMWHSKNIDILD